VCCFAIALFGCAPAQQPEDEWVLTRSEHVDFYTREPGIISDESLMLVDEHMSTMAERLGVELDEPVEVYLTSSPDAYICPDGVGGCYAPTLDTTYTNWRSLYHEVIHAIVWRRNPDLDFHLFDLRFWDEGLAEGFEGHRVGGGPFPNILSLVEQESIQGRDYDAAAHFVRWLESEYGFAPFVSIIDGVSFVDAFGVPLEDAVARYETSAPYSYDGWRSCLGEPVPPDENGVFRFSSAVRYDEPYVFNFAWPSSRQRYFVFTVETAGPFEIRLSSPDGPRPARLLYCFEGVLKEDPGSPVVSGVLTNESTIITTSPNNAGRDEFGVLELVPGTYQLGIPYNAIRVDVTITPL